MINSLEQTIITTLQLIFDKFGWFGVFGLMVFENATGLSPNEIILTLAGWMLIERHDIAPSFIPLAGIYAGLGSTMGASIPYWIARINGRPLIEKIANLFHIDAGHISKAEDQVRKWGVGIVLIGRVIPGLRTLISIPAGLIKIPFLKYFLATFIGTWFWCTLLIGAGYILGHEWRLIIEFIRTHLPLTSITALLILAVFLTYQYRAFRSKHGWIHPKSKKMDSQ
jgi:membrane protein DedA with SNARE-associated domain